VQNLSYEKKFDLHENELAGELIFGMVFNKDLF